MFAMLRVREKLYVPFHVEIELEPGFRILHLHHVKSAFVNDLLLFTHGTNIKALLNLEVATDHLTAKRAIWSLHRKHGKTSVHQ